MSISYGSTCSDSLGRQIDKVRERDHLSSTRRSQEFSSNSSMYEHNHSCHNSTNESQEYLHCSPNLFDSSSSVSRSTHRSMCDSSLLTLQTPMQGYNEPALNSMSTGMGVSGFSLGSFNSF